MPDCNRWIGALFCFFRKQKGAFLHDIGKMKQEKITYDPAACIALLRQKQLQLQQAGESRYPRRSDFSEPEIVAIKAFLGPWPRALEAAGLKPPRDDDRPARNREKRIRAKRRRTAAKKARSDQTEDNLDTIL
jgi:hypothetical protein